MVDMDRFIERFQGEPCLWDSESPLYHNRIWRIAAIERIAESMNLPVNAATVKVLKDKIKHLRTSFARELRELKKTERTSVGVGDVYIPKWKWFSRLRFLLPHVSNRPSKNNLTDEKDSDQALKSESEDSQPQTVTCNQVRQVDPYNDAPASTATINDLNVGAISSCVAEDDESSQAKLGLGAMVIETLGHIQKKRKQQQKDSFRLSRHYYFAMDMCQQLDDMPLQQAMVVRHRISNILYENQE